MSYIRRSITRPEEFKKVERLFKILSENMGYEYPLGFLAGGFARYICSPKTEPFPYRDVDVFCSGEESFQKLKDILKNQEKLHIKHENDLSVTFKTKNNEVWKECPMINLIKPIAKGKLLTFANNLEDILNNFDFSICRAGIISETEVLAHVAFYGDELNSNISILKMESPIATIMRIAKYAKKGYKINVPEAISILKEWDERGPEYRGKIYKALERYNNRGGWRDTEIGKVNFSSGNSWHVDDYLPVSVKPLPKDLNVDIIEGDKILPEEGDFMCLGGDEELYSLIRY